MQGKPLKLKTVGRSATAKRTRNQMDNPNYRHIALWEQIPGAQQNQSFVSESSLLSSEQTVSRSRSQLLLNEDPRKTRFIQDKLIVIDKLACILTTVIFFISAAKTEVDIVYRTPYQKVAEYLMQSLSLCILGLLILIVLRHLCKFELQACQNKVYLPKNSTTWLITAFFKYSGRVGLLLLEIFIILAHPVSSLVGETFQLMQTYDEISLKHSYNDCLSLLLGLKIYIIIRSFINFTGYASPRGARLCHQNGIEHNLLFILKCILQEHPLTAIALTFGMLLAVCGYCLKLTEGMVFLYNSGIKTGFQSYDNCFWTIFITMFTVGYGDYYPKTILGRTIMLITAILGVFLNSVLIISLSLYLKMTSSETNSHVVLGRLAEQETLTQSATGAMSEAIRLVQLQKKGKDLDQELLRKQFMRLKLRVDSVKSQARQIKSLVNTDNIVSEMSRLFYILKDNFKEVFVGQVKLKDQIQKARAIERDRLSFIHEVSNMISRPLSGGSKSLMPEFMGSTSRSVATIPYPTIGSRSSKPV